MKNKQSYMEKTESEPECSLAYKIKLLNGEIITVRDVIKEFKEQGLGRLFDKA